MAILTQSDFANSAEATRLVSAGRLVRLTRGVYSDESHKSPDQIVRESWLEIVGKVYPGAVITDRSGFVCRPVNGYLFISHPSGRELDLPGLTVVPRAGLGPQGGDTPIGHGVFKASEQRALVENTTPSRARNGRPARTLSMVELHNEIVRLSQSRTRVQNDRVVEAAREFARTHGRAEDAENIATYFTAARGECAVDTPSSAMRAAVAGRPYDQRRADHFKSLVAELAKVRTVARPENPRATWLPFYEAYFSNFIEGTEFTVEEAEEIALRGNIPQKRPADGGDIAGTFEIVNDAAGMRRPIDTCDEFLRVLRERHAVIMRSRPDKNPGAFKARANQAGGTEFVNPELVEGTLRAGWDELEGLTDPFARAAFVMFLVAEVHPFDDGNGRLARIMMNGELSRASETRIIIPTVMRSEYLSALVGLTHNGRTAGFVTVLDYAQRFTSEVDFSDQKRARAELEATGAFLSSAVADAQGRKRILPSQLPLGWEYAPTPIAKSVAPEDFPFTVAIARASEEPGRMT
jgi:Fic/DOC family